MLLRMKVEHAPQGIPPVFQEELQDELARLSRFVERSLLAAKAEQGRPRAAPSAHESLATHRTNSRENYQLLADRAKLADETWHR